MYIDQLHARSWSIYMLWQTVRISSRFWGMGFASSSVIQMTTLSFHVINLSRKPVANHPAIIFLCLYFSYSGAHDSSFCTFISSQCHFCKFLYGHIAFLAADLFFTISFRPALHQIILHPATSIDYPDLRRQYHFDSHLYRSVRYQMLTGLPPLLFVVIFV